MFASPAVQGVFGTDVLKGLSFAITPNSTRYYYEDEFIKQFDFLNFLPPELWIEIFQFLTISDISNISLVCKNFNQLATCDKIWNRFFLLLFKGKIIHLWEVQSLYCNLKFDKSSFETYCTDGLHYLDTDYNKENQHLYHANTRRKSAILRIFDLQLNSIENEMKRLNSKNATLEYLPEQIERKKQYLCIKKLKMSKKIDFWKNIQ